MLPGFRFLFAAIVLSLSILVFGLGAAAFLRAAHEQFASLPSRRAPAEPVFTRQNDAPMPTLALLRFDPPAIEKTPDNVPAVAAPETVTPAAQAPDAAPVEPEKLAALPEEPTSTDATAAAPATETTAAVVVESPAPVVVQQEVKVAAIAEAPQPSTAAAPAPATDTLSPEANIAATRIATLGGPIVIIDADAKPDRSTIRKRAAQRARERRRIAARRARLAARQAALAAQQLQANPFGQTQTQAQTPVARVAH
jgi:cytoskeletal protein RodZ